MNTATTAYDVLAHNYSFASDNRIHSDEVAAQYGFKGGLVPGVADIAYLARAVYDRWGAPWLHGGTLEVKLIKPIYHGERAYARALGTGDELELELRNPQGVVCAAGRAGLADATPQPAAVDFPRTACPPAEGRPSPTIEDFPAGHPLGAYEYIYDASACATQAQEMFVDPWPGTPAWHPALCLHDANRALRSNVALGPWIHTASRLQLYGAPADGELVSLRGCVLSTYEKRGHIMTDVDLGIFAAERAIARVRHTAIIRLTGTDL